MGKEICLGSALGWRDVGPKHCCARSSVTPGLQEPGDLSLGWQWLGGLGQQALQGRGGRRRDWAGHSLVKLCPLEVLAYEHVLGAGTLAFTFAFLSSPLVQLEGDE